MVDAEVGVEAEPAEHGRLPPHPPAEFPPTGREVADALLTDYVIPAAQHSIQVFGARLVMPGQQASTNMPPWSLRTRYGAADHTWPSSTSCRTAVAPLTKTGEPPADRPPLPANHSTSPQPVRYSTQLADLIHAQTCRRADVSAKAGRSFVHSMSRLAPRYCVDSGLLH
jgi:hypothetical protein